MTPTLLISFPRSGHHYLVNILKAYFGCKLKYCEYYTCAFCNKGKEKYHQRIKKAVEQGTNLFKQHDFQNDILSNKPILWIVRKNLPYQYVVLYREKVPAIISWFEMYCRSQKLKFSENDWYDFWNKASDFYNKWIKKWVDNTEGGQYLILQYKDLLKGVGGISRVIQHLDKNISINKELLERIKHKQDKIWTKQHSLRDIKTFKYKIPKE